MPTASVCATCTQRALLYRHSSDDLTPLTPAARREHRRVRYADWTPIPTHCGCRVPPLSFVYIESAADVVTAVLFNGIWSKRRRASGSRVRDEVPNCHDSSGRKELQIPVRNRWSVEGTDSALPGQTLADRSPSIDTAGVPHCASRLSCAACYFREACPAIRVMWDWLNDLTQPSDRRERHGPPSRCAIRDARHHRYLHGPSVRPTKGTKMDHLRPIVSCCRTHRITTMRAKKKKKEKIAMKRCCSRS